MGNAKLCQQCDKPVQLFGALHCRNCGYHFSKVERAARIAHGRRGEMLITVAAWATVAAVFGGAFYGYAQLFPGQTEAERLADLAQREARTLEREEYGLDCLDIFSGEHDGLVREVKAGLRDPNSFEHLNTVTARVDVAGDNTIMMEFTARNGFGGRNRSLAIGQMSNSTCIVQGVRTQRM